LIAQLIHLERERKARRAPGRTRKAVGRPVAAPGNWLSAGAIWLVVGAAAGLACWGHAASLGWLAMVAIPITIGIEIYCARLALFLSRASGRERRAIIVGLMGACALASAIFEHRGLEAINTVVDRERETILAERFRALETRNALDAQFNSLPQLPFDPLMLASMSSRSLDRIERVRGQWLDAHWADLERARAIAATPLPARIAAPLGEFAMAFIVGFIALLKVAGFWAISPAPAPAPIKEAPAALGGRELAKLRWAKARAAQAALAS